MSNVLRTRARRRKEAIILLVVIACGWIASAIFIRSENNPASSDLRFWSMMALGFIGLSSALLGFWRFAIKGEKVPKTLLEIRDYLGLDPTKNHNDLH